MSITSPIVWSVILSDQSYLINVIILPVMLSGQSYYPSSHYHDCLSYLSSLLLLVIADIDKKKIRKVVKKACAERRKIRLLKDVKIRKRFEEKVITLVDAGASNLWGHFKDGDLRVCDEVCGKKRERRCKGERWWWNEEVKEAVSRKKDAHRAMCQNNAVEKKRRYRSMKNKAKKAVSRAIRERAEEVLTELIKLPK